MFAAVGSGHYDLFLLLIAAAFLRASALEVAPHLLRERSKRVGLPLLSRSGPLALPMRARNEARRGLSPLLTGALRLLPGFSRS